MSPRIFIGGQIGTHRVLGRAKAIRGRSGEIPKLVLCPPPDAESAEAIPPKKKQPSSVQPAQAVEERA